MKNTFKAIIGIAALIIIVFACKKQDYSIGDLTAPSNVTITTIVVGQDATHPDGDGSGEVKITITADNALAYKVDYDASNSEAYVIAPTGTVTAKYTVQGKNTYKITAVVYGKGRTSSIATKEVTVRSDFAPPAQIITDLTGGASKTWIVDKSVPGHFGVGPWTGSDTPSWWSAGINEKLTCCPCFYTAQFTFTKGANNSYTLKVTTDAAFTKTGALTTLPGIPASGDEGCYSYAGGTSNFAFVASTTGIAAPTSTQVAMVLAGVNTYIGYGALLKEYEILELTPTYMYLRVQGTETGNAWYLKMKAI
jgi:hypothetical protein